ncbi:putative tetratricopeptide-like helical domain superfamily [Helianthus annuus]|nr:putative tetratricopeptide-like helical domain superfamily [Helianthus annuus]KAJ0883143.1 hypothetical protein HanPSC8_Chr10g0418011 [Helianthus annuus]
MRFETIDLISVINFAPMLSNQTQLYSHSISIPIVSRHRWKWGPFAYFLVGSASNIGAKWLGRNFGFDLGPIFVITPSSTRIFDHISTTLHESLSSYLDLGHTFLAMAIIHFAPPSPNLFILDNDSDRLEPYTTLSIQFHSYRDGEMLEPVWKFWKTYSLVGIFLLQGTVNWLLDINSLFVTNFEWKPGWQCGSVVKFRDPLCLMEHYFFCFKCADDVIAVSASDITTKTDFLSTSMVHTNPTHPPSWFVAAKGRQNKGLYFSVVSLLWHKLTASPHKKVRAESISTQQGLRNVVDVLCNVVSTSPTMVATAVVILTERINHRILTLLVELMWNHDIPESLILFHELLTGLATEAVSISSALSAWVNIAEIMKGMEIHGVCKLFDAAPKKDVASQNTLIMGYGMCGAIATAIRLFESLNGGNHDHVTCDQFCLFAVMMD